MDERSLRPTTPNEIAFEALNSVYRTATLGRIGNPDETVVARRDFTDGPSIEIGHYRNRLFVTVLETYGRETSFGIQRDGLADMIIQDKGSPRIQVNAGELEETERRNFMDASLILVPWIVERFLNKEAKPLPNHIVILFNDRVALKREQKLKEILTVVEAFADDFNKKVGGQLRHDVTLQELTRRDTREKVVGPMREYWMSLDTARKRYLVSSILDAARGLYHLDGSETTVDDIRSQDVLSLGEIRGIGPKKAAFLKRAFAEQS